MKVRRRFLFALMASILLHLGAVTVPGWQIPSLDDLLHPKKLQSLDAWLVKSTNKPPPAPAPKPVRRPPPRDSVFVPPAPEAPTAPESIPHREPAVMGGVDQPPPAPGNEASAGSPLPFGHLFIKYAVTMGEGGLVIGQAVQEFQNDGATYLLRSKTETTGLARLFKRVDLVHTSRGEVVDGGLRPLEFRIERDGAPAESALFDWSQGQVWLGERHFDLEPGAQDMLSMFCQLALMPVDGPSLTLPVVTGKKVERYEFKVLGEETLTTPMGEQPTIHLRTQGSGTEATDVWLGLNYARLPLRIRHVDRHGEVFDQVAGSVEIETTIERPH
jgi:hypothetical protein